MFGRLLVPLDGSPDAEPAIWVAADIARRYEATVHLLEVTATFEQTIALPATEQPELATPGPASELLASAYLRSVGRRLEPVRSVTHVAKGRSAGVIVEYAQSAEIDLIVMATHGRAGLGRLFLGSVTDEVIRRAGIPVLVTHAEA